MGKWVVEFYVTRSYLQVVEAETEEQAKAKIIDAEFIEGGPHWTEHRRLEMRFEVKPVGR